MLDFSSTTSRCSSVAFPRPPDHFRPFSSSFLLSMAFRALVRYQPDVPPQLFSSCSSLLSLRRRHCLNSDSPCLRPSALSLVLARVVILLALISSSSSLSLLLCPSTLSLASPQLPLSRCSSVPSQSSCKFSVCACLAVSLTTGTHPRYLAVNPKMFQKCSKSSRVMHSRFGAGTYPLSFQCFLCSLSVHHHHMALETLTVHLAIVVMYSPRHSTSQILVNLSLPLDPCMFSSFLSE